LTSQRFSYILDTVTQPTVLTPQELAARLGVSVRTVYFWNSQGTGPRYIRRRNRVTYLLADVEAWEAAQIEIVNDEPVPA
jgi:predicted DNA-binding transcriptional regulator AlpA